MLPIPSSEPSPGGQKQTERVVMQELLNSTRTLLDTSIPSIPARTLLPATTRRNWGYRPGTEVDDYAGHMLQLAMTPSGSR